jgi:hypothetical protein
MSARLLALESQTEQYAFINENMSFLVGSGIQSGNRFCHKNFITCMSKIYKSVEDEKSQSLILIGTENNEIIVLDKSGVGITKTILLKSSPVFMVTQGCFDVDYKIFVACRNGCTYQIKNGKVSESF